MIGNGRDNDGNGNESMCLIDNGTIKKISLMIMTKIMKLIMAMILRIKMMMMMKR